MTYRSILSRLTVASLIPDDQAGYLKPTLLILLLVLDPAWHFWRTAEGRNKKLAGTYCSELCGTISKVPRFHRYYCASVGLGPCPTMTLLKQGYFNNNDLSYLSRQLHIDYYHDVDKASDFFPSNDVVSIIARFTSQH